MTKQDIDKCIVFMLRMEADAQLNRTTSDEQFLEGLWKYQKSGVVLHEETLLKDVIISMQKGRYSC
jgi:hypothetical protein